MKDRKRGSGWPSSAHATELVCEVCESAPATVTCKADAAALCATCDADIHTANPLARRHLRLPIHQYMVDNSHKFLGETMNHRRHDKPMKFVIQEGIKLEDDGDNGDYEKEAKSWLLSQPVGNSPNRDGNGLLFSDGEVNGYLDLLHYGESSEANQSSPHVQSEYFENERLHLEAEGNESVVLFQNLELKDHQMSNQQYLEIHLENYSGSFTRSVSMSSLDGSIVPEAVIPEHPSYGIGASNESMELSTGFPTVHIPQYTAMDRKARVLRYREKRKNRKFEKTIRYVSRKAYAETRPRIKGRFAKRTDAGRSRSRPDLFIYTNGGSRIWNGTNVLIQQNIISSCVSDN